MKNRSNPISFERQAEVDALVTLPGDQIQTDDAPEVQDWSNAKRGFFYRPSSSR